MNARDGAHVLAVLTPSSTKPGENDEKHRFAD